MGTHSNIYLNSRHVQKFRIQRFPQLIQQVDIYDDDTAAKVLKV